MSSSLTRTKTRSLTTFNSRMYLLLCLVLPVSSNRKKYMWIKEEERKKIEAEIILWFGLLVSLMMKKYIHGKNYTLNAHNALRGLSLVGQVAPL